MSDRESKTTKPDSNTTHAHAPQAITADHTMSETPGRTSLDILHLQRTLGNRAVQRLLIQRDDGPEAAVAEPAEAVEDNPLTAGQVARARSFYAMRPDLYTPTIISQIQTEVGVEATGLVTVEMIQAVARFQRDEGTLTMDGMAGPRTLPAAFPSGLATDENKEDFADASEEVQSAWGTLTTAEERANLIIEKVNTSLSASGVHEVTVSFVDTGGAEAEFDFTTWSVSIGRDKFESDVISDEEMANLSNTIYHEARHAEQWYRIAQLLAGKGKTAAQIATETFIETGAVAAAVTDPIQPGTMEAVIAQGWYDSIYGRDSAHRERVLTELAAAGNALEAANDAVAADPSEANVAAQTRARARFRTAHADYKNLPEEADAHRVADELEALAAAELSD